MLSLQLLAIVNCLNLGGKDAWESRWREESRMDEKSDKMGLCSNLFQLERNDLGAFEWLSL
jgi:hypothetical protein